MWRQRRIALLFELVFRPHPYPLRAITEYLAPVVPVGGFLFFQAPPSRGSLWNGRVASRIIELVFASRYSVASTVLSPRRPGAFCIRRLDCRATAIPFPEIRA
jgi:hypothetical protein